MVDLNDNIRNTKPGISVSKSSAVDLEMYLFHLWCTQQQWV